MPCLCGKFFWFLSWPKKNMSDTGSACSCAVLTVLAALIVEITLMLRRIPFSFAIWTAELFPKNLLMPQKSAVVWQFELLWLLSWPKKYICHKNQLQFGSLNCFDCVGCLSCPIAQKNSLQFCSLSCLGCLSCPK